MNGIFFSICILTSIQAKKTMYCDLISQDTTRKCFIKETLTTIGHSPNQLAVDCVSNVLFFSFDFGNGEYIPALLNIDNKSVSILKGVKDAFAIAGDSLSEHVYFGGSHGIYKYSAASKTLQRLNLDNLDVWWLVIKNGIHFIKFPSLNAYSYVNKTIKPIPQLRGQTVHQFVIDKEDNIYFLNVSGLFGVKDEESGPILIKEYPKFVAMATDSSGVVYLTSEDGIYMMTTLVHKVKKYLNIPGVLGMTFDGWNNLIYSNSHEIVRLIAVHSDKDVEYISKNL